jgi:hypothetical protein
MRSSFNLATVLLCIIFIVQCQKKEPVSDVIAVIDKQYNITFEELIKSYRKHYYLKKFEKPNPKKIRDHLQYMIRRKLKILDAYAMNLDENPVVVKAAQYAIKPILFNKFYQTEVVDAIVSENEIKERYSHMGKTVSYRQIIVKKPDDATEEDVTANRKKIKKIQQQLQTGEDFVQLAQIYSEEKESNRKETLKKCEVWKGYHNPEIKMLIAMNEGDVSEFMENADGFYLFKLEQIEEKNKPPYKKAKREIKKYLTDLNYKQMSERFNEIISQGVDTKTFEWNVNAIDRLKFIGESVIFDAFQFIDTLNYVAQTDNMIIATYSNGVVDYKGFAVMFRDWSLYQAFSIEGVQDIDKLKEFIIRSVCFDYIVQKAIEQELDKDVTELESVKEALEMEMVKLYTQKMVDEKIPSVTEEKLKAFYETYADSLFYQKDKAIIYAKIFKEKVKAEKFAEKAKLKNTIRGLVDQFDFKMYEINKDGSYNYIIPGEYPLADVSFTLKVGEIAGPIEYIDKEKKIRFAVIRRIEKKTGGILSFEQVRKDLPKKFKAFHRNRIEAELIEDLGEKYSVVIYEQALERQLKD